MPNSRQPRPFSLPGQTNMAQESDYDYPASSGLPQRISEFFNLKFLLLVLILLQLVIIAFLAYPLFFSPDAVARQIVAEVRQKTNVSPVANPEEILPIDNVDAIRQDNEILAEIFKDAANGDYVLNYGDTRWLIYRRSAGQVIYDGPSLSAVIQQNEETLVDDIISKAKERGLYIDGDALPSFSAISDPEESRSVDPKFYAEAEAGDIIVVFADGKKVALYRPSSKALYKIGNINSTITIQ